MSWLHVFFHAWHWLHVFVSNFDWFVALFTPVVIGQFWFYDTQLKTAQTYPPEALEEMARSVSEKHSLLSQVEDVTPGKMKSKGITISIESIPHPHISTESNCNSNVLKMCNFDKFCIFGHFCKSSKIILITINWPLQPIQLNLIVPNLVKPASFTTSDKQKLTFIKLSISLFHASLGPSKKCNFFYFSTLGSNLWLV